VSPDPRDPKICGAAAVARSGGPGEKKSARAIANHRGRESVAVFSDSLVPRRLPATLSASASSWWRSLLFYGLYPKARNARERKQRESRLSRCSIGAIAFSPVRAGEHDLNLFRRDYMTHASARVRLPCLRNYQASTRFHHSARAACFALLWFRLLRANKDPSSAANVRHPA